MDRRGTQPAWLVAAALCGILLVAAALRVQTFRGYWGTDDGEYALLANALATGQFHAFVTEHYVNNFHGPAHLPYRIALVAPLSLAFRAFGVSEISLVAYPFLVSMLSVVLAFVTGRLLFGTAAGLIAASFWALLPVDVELATQFLPDGIASFYASVGLVAVLYMMTKGSDGAAKRFLVGLFAGLCFGASWLAKESVAYLVPVCGVFFLVDARKSLKAAYPLWIGVAAGSIGVLAAEVITYAVTAGDPFRRMHETERMYAQTKAYLFYEGSRFGWPVGSSRLKAVLARLFSEGPRLILLNERFLLLPMVGLLAVAHGAYWRRRAFFLPGVWLITLLAAYNFATTSFSSYTPLVLYHRNLHPLALPSVVAAAGLMVMLLASERPDDLRPFVRERKFWGGASALALIAVSAYYTFRQVRGIYGIRPLYEIREVARLVPPSEMVYTDPLSGKSLEFHWKYPHSARLVNFEGMAAEDVRPGSFVLVDRARLNWLKVNVGMWLTRDYGYHEPAFASAPPATWERLWGNQQSTLYRVR